MSNIKAFTPPYYHLRNADRHAYLIIAHNEPYILEKLVDLLDDVRNDIYIHIDKKSDMEQFKGVATKHSKLHWLHEIDVRWGDISVVEVELLLFETAYNNGQYSYYHLLSGIDLPIKTQDYIHDFFKNLPEGTNMIGFDSKRIYSTRVLYYHFFTRYIRINSRFISRIANKIRIVAIECQKALRIQRDWSDLKFYKGTNWVSVTSDFVKLLVLQKFLLLKRFRWTYCCDELYKQIVIMNSSLRETVFDMNLNSGGGTRMIDWTRGQPYTWHIEDYDDLMTSKALFARKFSTSVDKEIIDKIYTHISELQYES